MRCEDMGIMEVTEKGTLRSIDELGRIVLPIELRQKLDLKEKDKVRVDIEDNKITLSKVTE